MFTIHSSGLFSPFRSGGDLLDAPPGRGEDEVRGVSGASWLQERSDRPGSARPRSGAGFQPRTSPGSGPGTKSDGISFC